MNMLRHYFISNSLDDTEVFEEQLEAAGVSTSQLHVLSHDEAEVHHHPHLHEVQSFMKNDAVHSALQAAIGGVCASVLVLAVAYFAGWTESKAGWIPFIFLSVVLLGFCTWWGGLHGIHRPNHNFARFEQALNDGKHVFFMDLEPHQEPILETVLKSHPQVEIAGTGTSSPHWIITLQRKSGMVRHS